jgi:hypothetical protein
MHLSQRLRSTLLIMLQEAALSTTGFPVPTGYGSSPAQPSAERGTLWLLRNPARQPPPAAGAGAAGAQAGTRGGAGEEEGAEPDRRGPLLPVFRSAPYSAEAARQRAPSTTARILVLDDGCTCRAPLAAAILQSMLRWGGGACSRLAGQPPTPPRLVQHAPAPPPTPGPPLWRFASALLAASWPSRWMSRWRRRRSGRRRRVPTASGWCRWRERWRSRCRR